MKEDIEEDIMKLKEFSNETVLYSSTVAMPLEKYKNLQLFVDHILSDHKRVLKENEELKKTNKVLSIELTKDKILQQDCLRTVCGVPIGEIPGIIKEWEKLKEDNKKRKNKKVIKKEE